MYFVIFFKRDLDERLLKVPPYYPTETFKSRGSEHKTNLEVFEATEERDSVTNMPSEVHAVSVWVMDTRKD